MYTSTVARPGKLIRFNSFCLFCISTFFFKAVLIQSSSFYCLSEAAIALATRTKVTLQLRCPSRSFLVVAYAPQRQQRRVVDTNKIVNIQTPLRWSLSTLSEYPSNSRKYVNFSHHHLPRIQQLKANIHTRRAQVLDDMLECHDANQPRRVPFGLHSIRWAIGSILLSSLVLTTIVSPSSAAPPIAIIAEELGYYPVQNRNGNVVYVSRRVQRDSTDQSIQLAQQLKDQGVVLAGTYWCPHTTRQKELFGRQAMDIIPYVECASQGYQANPALCVAQKVDGFPTWLFPGGKRLAGERQLSELAKEVGYMDFKSELEKGIPPLPGASCK